jgi:thimet oligopeptidase
MFLAALSLHLHDREAEGLDSTAVVAESMEKYWTFAYVKDTYQQASFGHLNGYSAVYYTYMWSLVIAKDLFTPFASKGVYDRETANRYRERVLAMGAESRRRTWWPTSSGVRTTSRPTRRGSTGERSLDR